MYTLTLHHTILNFNDLGKKTFQNTVGKGKNAGNQHFLLFPQCFLPFSKANLNFSVKFSLLSVNAFNFDLYEILLFGKELNMYQTTNF